MNTTAKELEDRDQVHQRVLDALVEGDRVTPERVVADDCLVIGQKGFVIGTDEWIGTHSERIYEQTLLEVEDSQVTTYDGLAARCDLRRSECLYMGETVAGLFRVPDVWRRTPTGWQLVAIQYTAGSKAAPDRDRLSAP